MLLEIIQYGHPTLKNKCRPVTVVDDGIRELASNMLETMYAAHGIGLAAPQVNVPLQMVAVDVPEDEESPISLLKVNGEDKKIEDIMPMVFINPILELSGPQELCSEGCLSIKKVHANISRPTIVKATLTLLSGEVITLECDGLLARCLQHECDHLNGVLFVDRASSAQKIVLRNKLKKIRYNAG